MKNSTPPVVPPSRNKRPENSEKVIRLRTTPALYSALYALALASASVTFPVVCIAQTTSGNVVVGGGASVDGTSARATDPSAARLSAVLRGISSAKVADALAVYVFDAQSGKVVFELNSTEPLKPASVQKVLTSSVAFDLLGPDYKFATRVVADSISNGAANQLFVQGGGDPELTIESAWSMAREVKRRGINSVKALVIDDSLFADMRRPVGQRAYQTGASALAFNYNTLGFQICPEKIGEKAIVSADPIEVPVRITGNVTTVRGEGKNVVVEEGGEDPSSVAQVPQFRVHGTIGAEADCAVYYRSVPHPELVFGVTFAKMLRMLGVSVPENIRKGITPPDGRVVFTQDSRPLSQLIHDLNHFSNNFIAEQLLFALGASEDGRLRRERGLNRLESYLASLGFDRDNFVIADACGLSHQNRISARMVGAVLSHVLEDEAIRPEFESSLAVGARSGTLKRRNFGALPVIVRGKTGTIDGVSSLAGYVTGRSGRRYAFVILQNGVASRDRALQFEEKLVSALAES